MDKKEFNSTRELMKYYFPKYIKDRENEKENPYHDQSKLVAQKYGEELQKQKEPR